MAFSGRHLAFFGAGFIGRLKARFTGKKTSFGDLLAKKLSDCEPFSDHFYDSTLDSIQDALKKKDFRDARAMVEIGAKTEASKYCIALMKELIDFIAFQEELTIELIPFIE